MQEQKRNEKLYYTIGEVAQQFDLNVSTIRFWENEFEILKPRKNKKGNRLFTPEDLKNLEIIHFLLKKQGMTIKGAKKKLEEKKEDIEKTVEIISRLSIIRKKLDAIASKINNEDNSVKP